MGLYRARIAPLWAMLVVVAVALGAVIGPGGRILAVVSTTLLTLALGGIGWRVPAMSDGDWERLPEQGDKRLQAASLPQH